MKFIKSFENHNTEMSREEMCDMLCSMGYEMNELEVCSDSELADMCRNAEETQMSYESNNMSREEMCDMLCSMGYEMSELEVCSDSELADMCKNAEEMEMMPMSSNEAKGEKWIQDAIKRPGSLRKKMKKSEGEKITKSEIKDELAKLTAKDKDKSKKGVQGLNKSDLRKFRQLNLAKTLKGLKEHQENENYMFFANVENICRMCREILDMDRNSVDKILSDGHGWAVDHVATSKDDMEEVYGFLKTHSHDSSEPSFDETEGSLAKKDLESEIKSFNNFK